MFFISTSGIHGEFSQLPLSPDPSDLTDWKFGGCSFFREGNDMYYVVSRCHNVNKKCVAATRSTFIYKLNKRWTGFAHNAVVARWTWPRREAPFIFKHDNIYYLAASETAGWSDSRTWFRQAHSLAGLTNASEAELAMHPENTHRVKSMGSQFRFLMKVGYDQWIFVGSRYPDEDPTEFDNKCGKFVMTPATFIDGVPHVYWKTQFSWDSYEPGDYDEHYHGGCGNAPNSKLWSKIVLFPES